MVQPGVCPKLLLLTGSILATPVASADSSDTHVCENNGVVRLISVEYQVPKRPLPCRVVYEKTNEGHTEYPWTARNEKGFCEKKARFLVDKLARLGWRCEVIAPREEPGTTND